MLFMKIYHPCPNCFDRRPIELSSYVIRDNDPDVMDVLRCRECGFIYRVNNDGISPDFPKRRKYFREVTELSHNTDLVDVFKTVEENRGINITGLSKILRIGNFILREHVSKLEKSRILDVGYLGNNRFLYVGENKPAILFKKLVQE